MRIIWIIIGWLLIGRVSAQEHELFSYLHKKSNQYPENLSVDEIISMVRGRKWIVDRNLVGKLNKQLHVFDGGRLRSEFFYYIPSTYDGKKPLPVLIYLHGRVTHAVASQGKAAFAQWKDWCELNGYGLILPSGQREFPWWSQLGEDHVFEALRYVAAHFSIDHNRIILSGVSDGGSSTCLIGMRYADRFSACVSWLGSWQVGRDRFLGNSPLFVDNCKALPWRIVTGGRDQVYPKRDQKKVLVHLQNVGVSLDWENYKKLKHDTSRVFEFEAETVAEWLSSKQRDPAPKQLEWSVDQPNRYGQHYWIQVRRLKISKDKAVSEQWVLPVLDSVVENLDLGVHFLQGDGSGLRVSYCNQGSVGEAIGLKPWDIVLQIDDRKLSSIEDWEGSWRTATRLIIRRNNSVLHLPVNQRVVSSGEPKTVGRITAKRDANRIDIQSQNIAEFDIMVSPDLFDLSKELVVFVNEQEYFRGRVMPNREFMLSQLQKRNGDHSVIYVGYIPVRFDPYSISKQ